MTDYREQAIRDVAGACNMPTLMYHPSLFDAIDPPDSVRYAVAQRERVLALEAQLQQKEGERG